MFQNLQLQRPLAIFDLETTGVNPAEDRIVEISVLKVWPDGRTEKRTRRLNPGRPIPAAATAVHGISDADVADQPKFSQIASGLIEFLDGCDLCGYNIKDYDLRLLNNELRRIDAELPMAGRSIIDPKEIFHSYERRDLTAALRFYCDDDHKGAHGAEADVLATARVLDAMLARYADLPRNVAGIHGKFSDAQAVDAGNFLRRENGAIYFSRGKHKGKPLDDVARNSPDYLEWVLREDFYEDTKALIREALARVPSRK